MRSSALLALLALGACRVEVGAPGAQRVHEGSGAPAGEVWIYTSFYQHVVDDLEKLIRAELPGVEPRWFTGGSEKVSQRLEAELAAGGSRADLLIVSDPFYYMRLKAAGELWPYVPPSALRVPRELLDADGAWLSSRAALMVIVFNTKLLTRETAPGGYAAMIDPKWKGQLIMGDPLASGTFFTTVAFLEDKLGVPWLQGLKANEVVSTGGSSSVIERVSSGEYKAGLVLLENLLAAQRKGAPIDYVLPREGAVIIPGPAAILRGARNPVAARAVMDLLFSEKGQALMVKGDMYAVDPRLPSPAGAPPWPEAVSSALPWSEALAARIAARSAEIRDQFHRIVQE